jgi:hypothetical protein
MTDVDAAFRMISERDRKIVEQELRIRELEFALVAVQKDANRALELHRAQPEELQKSR